MLKRIGAVLLGLLAASVVMMICEFTNSFLFPFPENFDPNDLAMVQVFTATLPWNAYLLVLLGWFLGSIVGGYIASRLVHARTFGPALVVGILLTIAGIANNVMLGAPIVMTMIGIVVFLAGSRLGYLWFERTRT